MVSRFVSVCALLFVSLGPGVASGAAQTPPTEHPVIKPMPNSVVKGRPRIERHGEIRFRVKEGTRTIVKTVGGQRLLVGYDIIGADKTRDKGVSVAEIIGNYDAEVRRVGGTVHARTANRLYFTVPRQGGGRTWCSLYTSAGSYTLDIVDEAALETTLAFDAAALRKALDRDGHVAVYGILFDVDQATLRQESQPVLKEITTLLSENPTLRLEVQGHTDATGSAVHNRDLSGRRAKAVVSALTMAGIAADRLVARGYGADKPVADNATEEGRQKNRRVELVSSVSR